MPAGVPTHEPSSTIGDDLGRILLHLPSSALLLRADEGIRPRRLNPGEAFDRLRDDAALLLTAGEDDAVTDRWTGAWFARQVGAVRRHLEPIDDPEVLVLSFSQEAFHGRLIGREPAVAASPVRVAYAVRWIELRSGLRLPAWRAWFPSPIRSR